jgi:hypothetical protein
MILLKIWLAGVVLIWLLIVLNCIFWLCYDWRWYFKGELPPRSVVREVRRLVKVGKLKEPVQMNVEIIKDNEGVVLAALMRFGDGSVVCFCDTLRRNFAIFKLDIWATILVILCWPGFILSPLIFPLIDMFNEKVRGSVGK